MKWTSFGIYLSWSRVSSRFFNSKFFWIIYRYEVQWHTRRAISWFIRGPRFSLRHERMQPMYRTISLLLLVQLAHISFKATVQCLLRNKWVAPDNSVRNGFCELVLAPSIPLYESWCRYFWYQGKKRFKLVCILVRAHSDWNVFSNSIPVSSLLRRLALFPDLWGFNTDGSKSVSTNTGLLVLWFSLLK